MSRLDGDAVTAHLGEMHVRKNDRKVRDAVRDARALAGVGTDVEAFVEVQGDTVMINMRDTMTLPTHAKMAIEDAVARVISSHYRVSLT